MPFVIAVKETHLDTVGGNISVERWLQTQVNQVIFGRGWSNKVEVTFARDNAGVPVFDTTPITLNPTPTGFGVSVLEQAGQFPYKGDNKVLVVYAESVPQGGGDKYFFAIENGNDYNAWPFEELI